MRGYDLIYEQLLEWMNQSIQFNTNIHTPYQPNGYWPKAQA